MPVHPFDAYINRFFARDVARFTAELRAIERVLDDDAEPQDGPSYRRLCAALARIRDACRQVDESLAEDKQLLQQVRDRYRSAIAHWFDDSPLMYHAKSKPHGYPGDYEMLLAIYAGNTRGKGIGGLLDLYFLNTELGRAVPARMRSLRDFLQQELAHRAGDVSVLNVACGPCEEFANGMVFPAGRRVAVTCLDYDREALEYAESQVLASKSDRADFRCVQGNALRMRAGKAFAKQHGKFDIVYSVGLCDYIPNRHLIPMLQGWRDLLHEDGLVYVAFKDAEKYDKIDYQWLVDWHFLQRTQDDCRAVFREAGYDIEQLSMARDATQTIMNFVATAQQPAITRFDSAHADGRATPAPGSVGEAPAVEQQAESPQE